MACRARPERPQRRPPAAPARRPGCRERAGRRGSGRDSPRRCPEGRGRREALDDRGSVQLAGVLGARSIRREGQRAPELRPRTSSTPSQRGMYVPNSSPRRQSSVSSGSSISSAIRSATPVHVPWRRGRARARALRRAAADRRGEAERSMPALDARGPLLDGRDGGVPDQRAIGEQPGSARRSGRERRGGSHPLGLRQRLQTERILAATTSSSPIRSAHA